MGTVAVLAAALLGGCAEDPTGPTGEHDEICVDENDIRVPDERCANGGGGHFVYFARHHGVAYPAYPMGSKVTGGSSIKPASGSFVRGGLGGMGGGGG